MVKLPGSSKEKGLQGKGLRRLVAALWGLGVVCLLVLGAGSGHAEEVNMENKLKVAFLLNFAKFTSWPSAVFSEPAAPFHFCVSGEDPFGAALNGLEKKQVGGRSIQIDRVANISRAMDQCQLVYLSPSEKNRLGQYLKAAKGKPILMVSDIPGFAKAGGTIELGRDQERLVFTVNNQAAKSSRLQLSSSLLQLAREVL